MSLEKSKYATKVASSDARKPKPKENQWREVVVSDSNLKYALEQFMHQTSCLAKDEYIDKVIAGEPVAGRYPLSIAILKRKED